MPEIILQHVTKRFDKFVAVQDLDLQIQDRGFITLLGPSGCGKTTTLRMIAGLETPTSGRILIDGVPVFDSEKGINLPPNKRDIGFLFQNYALWPHMTVYENIAYGSEKATREDVERVCKACGIHDYIRTLPAGYETVLEDDGANISKGQKQLMTIARAMLLESSLLILDEATSNVDTRTELRIQKAMRTLMADKTCFVIAHRLSTIRNADMILVVRDGEIVERGTHESLMQGDTFYRHLYNAQFA